MDSDSDKESTIEGNVEPANERADWGKAKYDYYYTDYVDKDYPSKLTAKEERLASIEQEEALRIQRKLMSTLSDVDLQTVFDVDAASGHDESQEDLIDLLEKQNKTIGMVVDSKSGSSKKRKRVQFEEPQGSDEEIYEDDDDDDDDDDESDGDDDQDDVEARKEEEQGRKRRPINMAMKKNRGLTPYKKKEYRNPRVKHKLKYKKAMSKRRRNVREAQVEYHRYSGETTGIKTSTVKSIKLC